MFDLKKDQRKALNIKKVKKPTETDKRLGEATKFRK